MKAFWNDCADALPADQARTIDLDEACRRWSDGRGVQGNFFGLIDDQDRTVQFFFEAGIPDDIEDARHLRIVLMDFPDVVRTGSHTRLVTIGEIHDLIATAFRVGADPRHFGELAFTPW